MMNVMCRSRRHASSGRFLRPVVVQGRVALPCAIDAAVFVRRAVALHVFSASTTPGELLVGGVGRCFRPMIPMLHEGTQRRKIVADQLELETRASGR